MNLRGRFIIILSCLTLLPMLTTGLVVGWWSLKTQQRQVDHMNRVFAEHTAELLLAALVTVRNDLEIEAATHHPAALSTEQVTRLLTSLVVNRRLAGAPVYRRLARLDAAGKPTAMAGEPLLPSRETWPDPTLTGAGGQGFRYGPITLLADSGEPVMSLTWPLPGERGGWLAAQIRLRHIWETVANLGGSPKPRIYILDQDNRLVTHHNPELVAADTVFDAPDGRSRGPGLSGATSSIYAHRVSLGDQPIKVVVERDWLASIRPIFIQLAIIGGLVLLGAAAVTLAGIIIIRDVVRPVEEMGRAAEKMGGGDMSVRVETRRPDEIGRLAAAFNTLAVRLEETVGNLKRRISERDTAYRNLSDSYQELESFTHVSSHHLQEPLRKMANFGELLHTRYSPLLDERGRRYVWYITDGATRMKSLIEDLLVYSRIGRTGLEIRRISLEAVMEAVKAEIAPLIRKTGARIEWDELPMVRADGEKISLVLRHLIDNAIKFNDNRPRIRVAASSEDGRWSLSVTDNGVGMEARYLGQIFELFQTLHSVGTYPGTGIGLALCKRIVELHGGNIWAESEPGRGSAIQLTIPEDI